MSGRKAWEVANVLSEVEKAQEEIVKNYQNIINQNLSFVEDIEKEIVDDELERKIEALKDKKLKEEFKNYKNFFSEVNKIRNELKKVFDKRNKLISQAQEIRKKIKHKQHYATAEYNEAVEVRKQINNCKNEFKMLKEKSEKLKHQVIKLRSFIENVEDIFEARREFLENLLKEIENKLFSEDYILLEDIAAKKDKRVSKIEYYDHYKNENNMDLIKKELKEVEELLENNNFDKAEKELNIINNKINKISDEADKIKENIESGLHLSLKIRDIMLNKAGFSQARIELIDGNPINGFKIYTKNGDIINFDEIKVDNGKPIINLDHIERAAGGCGTKWQELKDIFNKEGIPITDVTKNGYSVIFGGMKTQIDGKIKEKGHK
jgi:uncharacterized phage infection (PIP) family protein YhgE